MCWYVYSGNNVISRYEGNTDGTAYQTSSNPSFNYTQDPTQQPATRITSTQLPSMRSISPVPFTISLTCKYILIVRYSCSLFFRSDMDSPKSPRTFRPTILERGVKEMTGSRYPSKIKQWWIMRISLPHLMDKVGIWECFYGIIPTYVFPLPLFPSWCFIAGTGGCIRKFDSSPREHARDH